MSASDDYYIDLEPGKKCIAIRSRRILIWKGRESDGAYINGRPTNRNENALIDLIVKHRAELAQLRADLQAAQERIAEQARQLDAARELRKLAEELVNSLGYWLSLDQEPQECVKAELALGDWLAANPAPHVHLSGSGECVICGLPASQEQSA